MDCPFGHGFVTSILLIARQFALPPAQAWPGAGDHVNGLVEPEIFKGTEIDELTPCFRKKVIWHWPGTMDAEDARDTVFTLNRRMVAIDREPRIPGRRCRLFCLKPAGRYIYKTAGQGAIC